MRHTPVVIYGIKEGNQVVRYDAPFSAADDWVKNLSFNFKNRSQKNIIYIRFGLRIFDGTKIKLNYPFAFGSNPSVSGRASTSLLRSKDSSSFAFTEGRYNQLQRALDMVGFTGRVTNVQIAVDYVLFEDGTSFTMGQKPERDTSKLRDIKFLLRRRETSSDNLFDFKADGLHRVAFGKSFNSYNFKNTSSRQDDCYYTTGSNQIPCDFQGSQPCSYLHNYFQIDPWGAFTITLGHEVCTTDIFDPEQGICRIVQSQYITGECESCDFQYCDPSEIWCENLCECIDITEECGLWWP
jgi:hypothetical protein